MRPRYLCPADFVRLGNGCYYFSSHIASWQNAHFSCRDLGAQMVSLDSRWEDSTIRSYLTRPEFGKFSSSTSFFSFSFTSSINSTSVVVVVIIIVCFFLNSSFGTLDRRGVRLERPALDLGFHRPADELFRLWRADHQPRHGVALHLPRSRTGVAVESQTVHQTAPLRLRSAAGQRQLFCFLFFFFFFFIEDSHRLIVLLDLFFKYIML